MAKRPDVVLRNKSKKQREAVSRASKGRTHTEEAKRKMSLANIGNKKHLGHKHSDEAKAKIREARKRQIGEKHPSWKGDKVGYGALHDWVRSKGGQPNQCEICGRTSAEVKIEWANKDHSYKRKMKDFLQVCRSCHRKYDIKHNGYKLGCNN